MSETLEFAEAAGRPKPFSGQAHMAIVLDQLAGPKCVTDIEEFPPVRAKLVGHTPNGTLRCYCLCKPKLVTATLASLGRGDAVVKSTPAEISADKNV